MGLVYQDPRCITCVLSWGLMGLVYQDPLMWLVYQGPLMWLVYQGPLMWLVYHDPRCITWVLCHTSFCKGQ